MRNQVLGGRYRILDRIGEGGMANVYTALDQKLGRKVAIKVLHRHMAENEEIRKRFQLEAQAISGLDHSNIVKIYDYSGTESEQLWIVTEIIKGHNIAEFIQHFPNNRLHPIIACCIVREVCKALQAAHDNGLVHRDIKPENVMLTLSGAVKLMDFGIAKDTQHNSMTQTGTFMGSPSYMSPEQIRGKDIDLRSDIYSLGVLFYEVLTGRLPYAGNSMHDVVVKIIEGGCTPPRFFIPGLSTQVDAIVCKAIAKQPAQRYASAVQYGQEIDAYLKSQGFDESHVELERFSADRKAFAARLKRPNSQKDDASAKAVIANDEPTRRLQLPMPSTKTSFPVFASTQKEQMAPTQILRPAAQQAIDKIRAHNQTALERPTSAAAAGWARQSLGAINAPRRDHVIPSQHMPPRAPASPRKLSRNTPHEQRRRTPRHRSPQQAVVFTYHRPAAFSSFLGAFAVGLLIFVAFAGFWSFSKRWDQVQIKPEARKKPTITKSSPRVPTAIKAPASDGKSASVSELSGSIKPSNDSDETKASKPKTRNSTNRDLPKKAEQLSTANQVPPTPIIVATKKNQNTSAALPPSAIKPATDATTDDKIKSTPKPVSTDDASIMLSSQPAAEIFINGKRYGTTLDETSSSGWLRLKAGKHAIELRRANHATQKINIDLQPGERNRIPNVVLQPATIHALKIRAAPLPANVVITNSEGKVVRRFTMNTSMQSESLPTGRYQIKITHKDKVMDREFWLPDPAGTITVNAEFRLKAD